MSNSSRPVRLHANLQDLLKNAVRDDNNCLIWQLCKTEKGYPIYSINKQPKKVHRLVCALIYGQPTGNKNHALHSCDNPSCINPDHLRWGSNQDNIDDKIARNRHKTSPQFGKNNPMAKLSDSIVLEIRQLKAARVRIADIAAAYGIAEVTVRKVSTGERWGHIK